MSVRFKLTEFQKCKSHIWLTARGFVLTLEHSKSPNIVKLKQAIEAQVDWELFKVTFMSHGFSQLSPQSNTRLAMEVELEKKILPYSQRTILSLKSA